MTDERTNKRTVDRVTSRVPCTRLEILIPILNTQALACPFAANHAFALGIGETDGPCLDPPLQISDTIGPVSTGWVGNIASNKWGVWVDVYLLLIFGGIPWQVGYCYNGLGTTRCRDVLG